MASARVEVLLPVELGPARMPWARGIRAGSWVFASGAMATDTQGGPAAEMVDGPRPLSGQPRWYREASRMFRCVREVLQAGATDFSRAVRTDQFCREWRVVPFMHQARRECCGSYVPPSTTVLEPGLRLPQASMSMEVIAIRPDSGLQFTPVYPPGLDVPATSSFAPVAKAGDYVFIAGFLAAWKPGDLGGIAPEAKVPAGHLWKGNRIQLEADYIIRNKLVPALDGAGASLESVVKAQVYLADINDVPAFNQTWVRHFGDRIPATTFIPTADPGFAISEARCEINLVALVRHGKTTQVRARGTSPAVCDGHPVAVRAGELLCFSGLVAADESGLVKGARRKSGSSVVVQMEHLLDIAERTCAEFGTSLSNVLRIQQFHTDLRELNPACQVWKRRLRGRPLPISAVQVPGPLLVPGCSVQLDLWIYVP